MQNSTSENGEVARSLITSGRGEPETIFSFDGKTEGKEGEKGGTERASKRGSLMLLGIWID